MPAPAFTRTVEPASAATTVYETPVAVAISAQFAPVVSQRVHWRAYEVGVFVQVPVDEVSD